MKAAVVIQNLVFKGFDKQTKNPSVEKYLIFDIPLTMLKTKNPRQINSP